MEQANHLPAFGIKAGDIRSFETIATDTDKGEIRLLRCTAMLASDDVIDLKRRGVECSGQLTVFAPSASSPTGPADEVGIQCVRLMGPALQSLARSGLHGCDEVSDVDVAVEFSLLGSP